MNRCCVTGEVELFVKGGRQRNLGGDTMRKTVPIALLAIGFLMIPFLIHAEVYKWIDDKGTIHFTDDYSNVPEKYLPSAEVQGFPKESSAPISKEKAAPVVAPKSSGSPELETPRLFSGLISGVDDSARSIVVTGDGKEMVFTVSEDTIIRTDSGKNLSFSDLKNDRPVTIEYMEKGGELQVQSVTVSILQAGATNAVSTLTSGGSSPPVSPQAIQPGGDSPPVSNQAIQPGGSSPPVSTQAIQPGGSSPPVSTQAFQPGGDSLPVSTKVIQQPSKK